MAYNGTGAGGSGRSAHSGSSQITGGNREWNQAPGGADLWSNGLFGGRFCRELGDNAAHCRGLDRARAKGSGAARDCRTGLSGAGGNRLRFCAPVPKAACTVPHVPGSKVESPARDAGRLPRGGLLNGVPRKGADLLVEREVGDRAGTLQLSRSARARCVSRRRSRSSATSTAAGKAPTRGIRAPCRLQHPAVGMTSTLVLKQKVSAAKGKAKGLDDHGQLLDDESAAARQ